MCRPPGFGSCWVANRGLTATARIVAASGLKHRASKAARPPGGSEPQRREATGRVNNRSTLTAPQLSLDVQGPDPGHSVAENCQGFIPQQWPDYAAGSRSAMIS